VLDGIPRIELLNVPTPMEHLPRIGHFIGHPLLWVKREDCMSLGLGGNKVRSLEYWLGEARARDSDILVVAGALASNQCRLTAAAAAKLGLDCLILYSGHEPSMEAGNFLLSRLMGAEARFLGPVSEEERRQCALSAVNGLAAAGRRPYLVGDQVVGALGYVRAAAELHDQAVRLGLDLRHVVLPGSMGPTEAGLIFGAAALGLPWTLHLVSVEYQAEELRARVSRILADLSQRIGLRPADDMLSRVRIQMDQLGSGYGVASPTSIEASQLVGRLEALILEQTYVAKTFAGLLACVSRGEIPPDEAACVIHTGGIPELFAQNAP
jgi:1-aminocyclopropane-1-carboxylate deaminase/D-cysteine desulfhydrase-like pyridoxal-dependent ACC family enzyme